MPDATALHWMLPEPGRCLECKAEALWSITTVGRRVTASLVPLHSCQCSQSEHQKTEKACRAAGGHFPVTHSAGQHSFDVCRECGHHC
jgi:hypothetical protein